MEAITSLSYGKQQRRRRGRKDASGQEAVTKPQVVRERLMELERLYAVMRDARGDFNDAVKACAEDAGYHAAVVRSHVIAIASDRYEAHKTKVSQQLELFEDAGPLRAEPSLPS